jgi:hypothetical protein
MKTILSLFILLIAGVSSCLNNQWEDRVASGDTGSVTHGDKKSVREPFYCGNVSTVKRRKEPGYTLFRYKCAACHNASKEKSTGPGLMNVYDRIPAGEWRYDFIRNPDSVIKSGDSYANALYLEYKKSQHTPFPHLTNKEIDAILDYCN